MAEILIDGKPFYYKRLEEDLGVLNKENAKEFLSLIKREFEKSNILFFLNFGTLLGAYRDHDFISNDVDMDLGIFEKDMDSFYRLIPKLDQLGVKLCRAWGGVFFSFLYKGVVCDFNVYYKAKFPYHYFFWGVSEGRYTPKKLLSDFKPYDFMGEQYMIPVKVEDYLNLAYGKDWRIPQNRPGQSMPDWMFLTRYYIRIKRKIRFLKCKYITHTPFE